MNEELQRVAAFMREFWQMIKRYPRPQNNDAWWDKVIDEGNALATETDNRLCTLLMVAFLRYLDEVQKNESTAT